MPAIAATALDALGREARRHHLLTAAEEIELARKVQLGMASDDPRVQRRGKLARERMINANLGLVLKNAHAFRKRISGTILEVEDLAQAGIVGLNRAVDLFDSERGYKFSTYGTLWITQSIRKEIETSRSTIKVANEAQIIARRWRYRPPSASGNGLQTVDEFCAEYGYKRTKVEEALFNYARAQCRSLDAKVHEGGTDGCSLAELIAAPESNYLETQELIDTVQQLREAPATRDAIAALELAETASRAEMAEILEIPVTRVSRRLQDAKAVIREHLSPVTANAIRGEETCQNKVIQLVPMTATMPATNGHAHLERLIEAEPQPQAEAQPKRRNRRTKAELDAAKAEKASKQPALIAVELNGHRIVASAECLASLLSAMPARATA